MLVSEAGQDQTIAIGKYVESAKVLKIRSRTMGSTSSQAIVRSNEDVSDAHPSPYQDCNSGIGQYDEQFHLVSHETGRDLGNVNYRITASTCEIFSGTTDAHGFTRRIVTVSPAKLIIEVIDFEGEEEFGND